MKNKTNDKFDIPSYAARPRIFEMFEEEKI